jgi:dienelactone hydrolase
MTNKTHTQGSEMKEKLVRRNSFWLALSLVLMVVSSVVASAVQTSGYTVTVKDMSWETSNGESMSALLYKPNGVSADNKAPAIVVAHGWWNNKEMQDANYVELARRGYVVLSIDMYGHGDSDYLTNSDITLGGTGVYDGVKLLADLPYVDTSKIGVSGHSNGARAANFSVAIDNAADKQLIAAVFLVDNDPVYTDAANDNAYFNMYGDRDTGLVADQYDEFFFRSYSAEGVRLTSPRDYIGTPNAQSFLNYGSTRLRTARSASRTPSTTTAARSGSSTPRPRRTRGERSRSRPSATRSRSGRRRSAPPPPSTPDRRPGSGRSCSRPSASSGS